MFGKILYIGDNIARVALVEGAVVSDIMNLHVIFEDEKKQILGEVDDISDKEIKISFLGEIVNGKFVGGVIRKPSLTSKIRPIDSSEMRMIVGESGNDTMLLGYSPLYDDCPVRIKYNDLFSNHMAIFGNTGSGKSCGVARLLQNVFNNKEYLPFRSNIFLFDAYGEYHNAFRDINKYNVNLNFKYYTTNLHDTEGEILNIPLWLLDVDDMAILLGATNHGQITILERALKLVAIFAENSEDAHKYKNHLIAKAIMTILYTNQTSASKRNDIFSIIQTCSTPEFNLESIIQGVGYQRRFRECFIIDTAGNFCESVLITQYIQGFIDEELEKYEILFEGKKPKEEVKEEKKNEDEGNFKIKEVETDEKTKIANGFDKSINEKDPLASDTKEIPSALNGAEKIDNPLNKKENKDEEKAAEDAKKHVGQEDAKKVVSAEEATPEKKKGIFDKLKGNIKVLKATGIVLAGIAVMLVAGVPLTAIVQAGATTLTGAAAGVAGYYAGKKSGVLK